jgi:hypothetical protein
MSTNVYIIYAAHPDHGTEILAVLDHCPDSQGHETSCILENYCRNAIQDATPDDVARECLKYSPVQVDKMPLVIGRSTLAENLESLVDQHGLGPVLDNLHAVCDEKADHLASAWQDKKDASLWRRAARRLGRIVDWLTV